MILQMTIEDPTKNRGYGFVEYETHRDAALARRQLVTSSDVVSLVGRQTLGDFILGTRVWSSF